eukprot:Awhi_evm1s1428
MRLIDTLDTSVLRSLWWGLPKFQRCQFHHPISAFKNSKNPFIIPLKKRWFLVALINACVLGQIYAFPLYTSKLLGVGLSTSQIVLFGISGQCGMGLAQFSLHYLSTYLHRYMLPKTIDRLLSLMCGSLLSLNSFFVGLILYKFERDKQVDPAYFGCLLLAFLFYGAGQGLTGSHLMDCSSSGVIFTFH